MITSFNNQIVAEPYKGSRGIKSKVSSGVAVIQQKSGVIGLKVLENAVINDQLTIKKGDTVFLREEVLHVNSQYSNVLECSTIKKPFTLINFAHVVFVEVKS